MKKIDRYLIRQFISNFFFGLMTFILIFVLIDMMENLDRFIGQNVPGSIIAQYYLSFIPEILRLMMPVSVLLSCLFTSGKMSSLNELTAIRSSGVSLYRFMLPFLLVTMLISLFAVYFGGYVVPFANKHKAFLERTYMKKGIASYGNNIFFQEGPLKIICLGNFDPDLNKSERVSIQEFDKENPTRMRVRTDAATMIYSNKKKCWVLYNVAKREFSLTNEESLKRLPSMELKDLQFKPQDVIKKQQQPEEMSLKDLQDFAKEQLESGYDPTRIKIEYYSRIAFGFSCFIVTLFGLPISANKRKGGLALQFGLNLGVAFVYLFFIKLSQAFGKNGVMDPLLTAWFANIIFLVAALINLVRAEK